MRTLTSRMQVTWLQAFITYETAKTRGKGFVRLRESAPGAGDWAAYTFFVSFAVLFKSNEC